MGEKDGKFVLVEGGRLEDEEVDLLRRAAADPAKLELAIGGLRARGLKVKLIDDPAPKSPPDDEGVQMSPKIEVECAGCGATVDLDDLERYDENRFDCPRCAGIAHEIGDRLGEFRRAERAERRWRDLRAWAEDGNPTSGGCSDCGFTCGCSGETLEMLTELERRWRR
jgi:hypothetical protein